MHCTVPWGFFSTIQSHVGLSLVACEMVGYRGTPNLDRVWAANVWTTVGLLLVNGSLANDTAMRIVPTLRQRVSILEHFTENAFYLNRIKKKQPQNTIVVKCRLWRLTIRRFIKWNKYRDMFNVSNVSNFK